MAKIDFALIGDSHAGTIGRAARERDLKFGGGPMASGKEFYSNFFRIDDGKIQFTVSDTRELYAELCELWSNKRLEELDVPIISTIGSGFHFPAAREIWASFQNEQGEFEAGFTKSELFDDIITRMLEPMVLFHQQLIKSEKHLLFVLPPQRFPGSAIPEVFQIVQEHAQNKLANMGCAIIDLRKNTCDELGRQLPEYSQDNDPIHGNIALGQEILKAAGF